MKNVLKKLLKVKSTMGAVSKSADNPFFKSKYADLNSHLDLVEPLLAENGLILLQPVESDEAGDKVVTRILDAESGEEVRSEMHLILPKSNMQDAGSAITYARRYTLGSLLGMKAEDDDGEKSMGRASAPKAPVSAKSSFRKKPTPSSPTTTPAKVEVKVDTSSEENSWE